VLWSGREGEGREGEGREGNDGEQNTTLSCLRRKGVRRVLFRDEWERRYFKF